MVRVRVTVMVTVGVMVRVTAVMVTVMVTVMVMVTVRVKSEEYLMPLAYTQRHVIRERILLYGGPGTGKSTAIATIVLHTPDVHHYIVDNEIDNYERLFAEDERLAPAVERGNYTIYPVDSTDWKEQLDALTAAGKQANPGDWLHYDMITDSWEAVQGWFTNELFDTDLSDYFLSARKAMEIHNIKAKDDSGLKERKSLQPFEGFTDWAVINPEYKKLYRVFMQTRAHVSIAAEEQQIQKGSDKEDRLTRDTYGEVGYKPRGQKKLGHIPHTVIRLTKNRRDEWMMTTVKDRGREYADEVQFTDWAKSYLLGVAKWKARKVD